MRKTLLINLFLILFFPLNCISQGLLFQGLGTDFKERSTLSVFENKTCEFNDYFDISFRFLVYNPNSFGCIFLLENAKTDEEYNLMFAHQSVDHSQLKFNIGGKDNLFTIDLNTKELEQKQWVDFSMRFDLNVDSIYITVNNQSFAKGNLGLSKNFEPKLEIGFIERYAEVAPFILRDLKVGNTKKNYQFPLNESEGNDVHDSNGHVIGQVSNPIWLINASYHWKQCLATENLPRHGANYHASNQNLLFFHKDSIRIFNTNTHHFYSQQYENLHPINTRLGTSFLDERANRLYVYEAYECVDCDGTVASLDLNHFRWETESHDTLFMQLHHHSGFLDTKRNQHIIFGGFGNRRYNKYFFSYDLSTHQWDTIHYSGDEINPRYFQGMAESDNNLYVFGGMGNDTGDQTIGRRNYYDLYKFDLDKRECTKLWEIDWKEKHLVPARNMVIVGDSLYALCYPEYESNSHIQLYRFSIKDGSYKTLGDSILFCSDEILTNVNLFYDDALQEFYCVVLETNKDNSMNTKVYSLMYPGVSMADLSIYKSPNTEFQYWYLLLFLGCLVTGISYRLFSRKKQSDKIDRKKTEHFIDTKIDTKADEQIQSRENGICLFGKFTIYDKTGRDITYMLSTRLKNTFLLILEYSLTKGGITSHQISNILWSDKDEYSAKNLRGVTVNQLRKILTELDGIKLVFDNGLYTLIIEQPCFCDCKYLLQLMNLDIESEYRYDEINNILSRGGFLKSIDEPMLDTFKVLIKDKLSVNLPIYIEEVFKSNNYLLAEQLSNHLLSIDPLNVDVFSFQLRSLYQLKQVNEVKKRYALFSSQYHKLTNKPLQDLSEILNDTN